MCPWKARACARGRDRQDRPGSEGGERAGGTDWLVRGARPGARADRAGGRALVAMALRGDAADGSCGRASGDAACPGRVQGDAGEVGPQRCARDRPVDAARLVSAGALQIDCSPGGPRAVDGAQAGAIEAVRRGDEPAGHFARVRPEGRSHHAFPVRWAHPGTGHRPSNPGGHSGSAAGGTRGVAAGVRRLRTAGPVDGPAGWQGPPVDVCAWCGAIVALTYVSAIDDPARFRSSKDVGAH